jgi:serine protease
VGDRLQNALNLGNIMGSSYSYVQWLGSVDPNDFYRFQLDGPANVTLDLQQLEANADLFLYDSSGNVLASSTRLGQIDESIRRRLEAGIYYVQLQNIDEIGDNIYFFNISADGFAQDPGQSFATARDLGTINYKSYGFDQLLTSTDFNDYYQFDLINPADVQFRLTNLSADLNLALYNAQGGLVTVSNGPGIGAETLAQPLAPGRYYLQVYTQSQSSAYSLDYSAATTAHWGIRTLTGTFGADTFRLGGRYSRTVISGNGNLNFGSGQRDRIDLSTLSSQQVSLNLATSSGGGVLYNPGNGTRLFDSLQLPDGQLVLFEGIERIDFSDLSLNLAVTPNDPLFNQQWNLGMMGVPTAWRFTTGSNQVMIGIQDTGLALDAQGALPPDLRNIWYGLDNNYADDFFDQRGPVSTSHGTGVQSIVGAISGNGVGMSSINWNSDLYVADVLGGNPGDFSLTEATQIMAGFAASRGQRLIINMSLGYRGFNDIGIEPDLEATVIANPNVLFVIATGNNGHLGRPGIDYPANLAQRFANVVAVGTSWGAQDVYGAPTVPGTRITYPGPFGWGSQYGDGLTLMGPSEVVAQQASQFFGSPIYDHYDNFDGTSAATPNVTGVASLVWSANPNLTAVQVAQILSQTAIDLYTPGYDVFSGHGFINADAAVRRAIAVGAGYA